MILPSGFMPRARAGWRFLREFIRHPVMVGSIVPSSETLIERMLAPVDWERCTLFVEYGPGIGVFTRRVLERLRPDAVLVAIETNTEFVGYLQSKFNDPRLHVIAGSAENVRSILEERALGPVDYVVSGLPFSTLPAGVGTRIVEETAACLRSGGVFLVYQFSPAAKRILKSAFARIDDGFEWRNIPPVVLYWASNPERRLVAAKSLQVTEV